MPSHTTIVATKAPSGRWMIVRDHEDERPGSKERSQVTLPEPQGIELEHMLSNPCLYAEPDVIGNAYPTASGKPGACFDGGNTYVDIRYAGRRRTAVQACEVYGLTGKLVDYLRGPFRPANAAKRTL